MKNQFIIILGILFFSVFGCKLSNNNKVKQIFSDYEGKSNYEKGIELIKEKNYDAALENFDKIEKGSKEYEKAVSKINYISGLKDFNDGKFEEALEHLNKVKEDDEFYPEVIILTDNIESKPVILFEYGLKLFKDNEYEDAILKLKRISNTDKLYLQAHNLIIFCKFQISYDKQNYTDAIRAITDVDTIGLNSLIDLKPFYLNLGSSYYELKKYNNALTIYSNILKYNPNDTTSLYMKGECFYLLEKYSQAITVFDKILKLYPKNIDILYKRGKSNYFLNKYDNAIKDFSKVISLNPYNYDSYHWRGECYYYSKYYSKAFDDFNFLIYNTPPKLSNYFERGKTYEKLYNYDRALNDFYSAYSLYPDKEWQKILNEHIAFCDDKIRFHNWLKN